jgi:Zn-dependent protease with chaperone function
MRRAAYIVALFAILGIVAGAVDVPPQVAGQRPAPDTDEAGLWLVMDKAEERLKNSAMLERDPALNAYVRGVVCRLTPDFCPDVRVYVIDQPYFNANMAPNGAMQVYTGLLLRVENEAQLAFVLGHETGHYVGRHSLEQWRKMKNTANALLVFSIGASAGGVGALGTLAELAAASTIYGYSRDKEREADGFGFKLMTGAGYAGRECAETWRYLVEETAHSDSEKTRKEEARGSIFRTHPLTSERIETLDELAKSAAAPSDLGAERFRGVVEPHLGKWLKEDLRRRDFGESLFLIDRLIADGRALGTVYFYKAEAFRLRHKEGDDGLALTNYEKATAYPGVPVEAFRELGQAYWRQGNKEKADASFRRYLELAPEAQDRLIVDDYLKRLWTGAAP